jgi:hypothetical protein
MRTCLTVILSSSLCFLCPTVGAQEDNIDGVIDTNAAIKSARESDPRQLTVLAPTLSAAEIDQAILNRLMQEIAKTPSQVMGELRLDETKLQDLFISLSNARSFINTNEIASIRSMCNSFNNSELNGDDRIAESLAAYERRSGYTKRFIASFYKTLISDIEHGLSPQSLVSFQDYMDDRRRRMATAGNVTLGIPTDNVNSGREAVEFHCGPGR